LLRLLQVLDPEQAHVYQEMTLGQYLDSRGYSHSFKYNYVLPMCAAVWSVPNSTVSSSSACTTNHQPQQQQQQQKQLLKGQQVLTTAVKVQLARGWLVTVCCLQGLVESC
jgi:predicted NAD/FAD-binding protein